MQAPFVTACGVGKVFSTVRAVDNVSFTVRRAEIFSLLGPNGAGKSTLVRMLIGMLPTDQGAFAWFDENGGEISRDTRQIGYLPEERGLYQDQLVQRTLEYFGQLRGMNRSASRTATNEWLDRLDMRQYAKSKLGTLSKGNQQKIQIATAVLHRPSLAVLDEPFSGLDPINQEMMIGLIRELRDKGATILLSAHNLNLVERLSDRVLLISKGREVLAGTVNEIRQSQFGGKTLCVEFAESVDQTVLLNLTADPAIKDISFDGPTKITARFGVDADLTYWLRKLSDLGSIQSFHSGNASLHDIYLRSVGSSNRVNQQENEA